MAATIFTALTGKRAPIDPTPPPPEQTRIACIGDSITEGSSYPAIDELAKLSPKPRVFLCKPLPVIGEGNFGIDNARLTEGVLPAFRRLAKDYEFRTENSETMILIAATRLMLARLS
ncbi:MAG: Transposase domain [Chthoniobacter sp.]|jgi:hypothetical protein|nr:Transposase domain [Chthoniobacter sp.]